MPIYIYKNPKTNEVVEIMQSMREDHVYRKDGIEYERVYTVPRASVDSVVDITNKREWLRYTDSRKGTVGDLMDLAAEASQKREGKLGKDPVKEKYYENYSKARNGKKHPDIIAKEARKKIEKLGVLI